MHALNISGLATYVNCPEIYQANDHFSAPFPRRGFPPDRHVHERGARRGPDAPVSGRSQERCRRRLSRDQGPRPVPLARGPGLARKPRLDRGGKPAHRRLPRRDPRAQHDPRAADEALELSEVRRAIPEGTPLLLFQERWSPEPVSALQTGVAHGGPGDAARPEPTGRRRYGGALDPGGLGRRAAPGLRHVGERLRLGGVPRARCRGGARPVQPDWGMNAEVTDDGRYAVLQVWLGTDRRNRVYYLDLKDAKRPKVTGDVVRLLDDFDASYAFVGNDGPVFYFLTDLDAPRKRVIAIDTRHPERARWREIIPQAPDVLDGVQIIHDTFVANYMHDASSRLRLFARDGRFVKDLPLPTLGSIGAISGERKDDEMFYAFTSFLYPTTIFRYDFRSGVTSVFKAPAIDFDPSGYEIGRASCRERG